MFIENTDYFINIVTFNPGIYNEKILSLERIFYVVKYVTEGTWAAQLYKKAAIMLLCLWKDVFVVCCADGL